MIETSKLLAEIIQVKLGLENDQIWVRDQNIKIPDDERLYISIGMVSSEIIGNNNIVVSGAKPADTFTLESIPGGSGTDLSGSIYFDGVNATLQNGELKTIDLETGSNLSNIIGVSDGDIRFVLDGVTFDLTSLDFSTASTVDDVAVILDAALDPNILAKKSRNSTIIFENESIKLHEKQLVLFMETVQIDLFSRSDEARDRRYELLSSLTSIHSVQKQEENGVNIFRVPSAFINTSAIEGGSRINRYTIRMQCNNAFSNLNEVTDEIGSGNFYDQFKLRVDDEESISEDTGIIEIGI